MTLKRYLAIRNPGIMKALTSCDHKKSVYSVPSKPNQIEITVKKSRFVATASYASDRAQALASVETARAQFPDAGHHCWAYLIGAPDSPVTVAMSDDGEPSGTAGKPILNVLQHKQVGNVAIVVSRYFGGIKLGAGGLVRAYSSAAQGVMESLAVTAYVPVQRFSVWVDFAVEQDIRHWMSVHQGSVLAARYTEQVCCDIEIAVTEIAELEQTAAERGWRIDSSQAD